MQINFESSQKTGYSSYILLLIAISLCFALSIHIFLKSDYLGYLEDEIETLSHNLAMLRSEFEIEQLSRLEEMREVEQAVFVTQIKREQSVVSAALARITSWLPEGVILSSLSVEGGDISFSGLAESLVDIGDLLTKIEEDSDFALLSLSPITRLVGMQSYGFSMRIIEIGFLSYLSANGGDLSDVSAWSAYSEGD